MKYAIGNWIITENEIEYKLKDGFFIGRGTLVAKIEGNTYDWLLHVTEKKYGISFIDILMFNTVFLFAANYYSLQVELTIFESSILAQTEILSVEDTGEDEISL